MKRLRPRQYAQTLIQAVDGLSEPQRLEVVKNFIALVHRQRAGKMWPRIIELLRQLEDQAAGVKRAQVTGIPTVDQAHLTALLQSELGPVVTEFTADPDQIGGLRIRIGDDLYDHTLRAKLDSLRLHLANH